MVEFASEDDATSFHSTYQEETLLIGDRVARVAWAAVPSLSAPVRKSELGPPSKSVFVGNLLDATREDLLELATKFGPVRRVRLSTCFHFAWYACCADCICCTFVGSNPSRSTRSYAHIDFENLEDAKALVATEDLHIRNQPLRLDFATSKEAPEYPPNQKLYFSDYQGPEEELKQSLKPYLRKIVTVFFRMLSLLFFSFLFSQPFCLPSRDTQFSSC
jgi:hypothetical protein